MPRQARPNFLFLFPDQHRFDFLGLNPGLPLRTPNLDALAARGTRLTRMICPSPLCAPSRASLASGRSYRRCGVLGNDADYPLRQPTFYASLRDSGYRVAGVGKFELHKATLDWGIDGSQGLQAWGFSEGIDSEGKHDGVTSGATAPKGPYLAHLHARGLVDDYVKDMRAPQLPRHASDPAAGRRVRRQLGRRARAGPVARLAGGRALVSDGQLPRSARAAGRHRLDAIALGSRGLSGSASK